jgi:hypothetical protein
VFGEVGGRRRGKVLAVLLAGFGCGLAVAPAAMATQFTVDSSADQADALPGDESCLTAGGKCTFRAAIEAANSLEESTRIDFEEETFEGQAAATIALGSSLPALTVPAFINGRTCETEAGVSGPCVGIDGPNGEPALIVGNAEEVEISGLAMTSAQTAITLVGAPRTKIQGSWFGFALDGALAGNETGVLVSPGSNRSLIGGEGPGLGNVFAGNAQDGLDVHGGKEVRVFGNYFGVEPDGITPAANGGDDIEVAALEGSEVAGTSIGTRVTFGSSATSPQCDGGCNVISGAESSGIDLEGDGPPEVPAVATAIRGNHIGLNADGEAAIPNAAEAIRVGSATQTVIGGPKAADANRISGGPVGILAGPAAADLVIRGNLIGFDADGVVLSPPDEGIVVSSEEVPSTALEATISDNDIGMEGGVGIVQRGLGATIRENAIFGAETGIETHGPTEELRSNLIEGNSIEGSGVSGILVENNFNEIVGNEIFGSGGAGIWIQGSSLEFGVSGNLVGGDAAADENVIDSSGGAAIEISNPEATVNEVARNRGAGNVGPFIDLVAASPGEPKGPNGGIEPPVISSATQLDATGGGAEPGANVRVFSKQLASPGEIASFLGEGTADGAGNWKVVYEGAVPGGTIVAATQTSEAGGTSELSTPTANGVVIEDGGCAFIGGPGCDGGQQDGGTGGGGPSAGGVGSSVARFWPRTTILKTPKRRSRSNTARFEFESDEPGSRFLCRLDGKPFDLCRSPKRYKRLAPGRHLFEVRAIDPDGHLDPTPAKKKFTVLG